MDLAALRKKIGKAEQRLLALDEDGLLAAPVDVLAMFHHGIVEATKPTNETKKGTLIVGSVKTAAWRIAAPVWVTGNVVAKSIELASDLVIEGSLAVTGDVRGRREPNTLTVLGKVTLKRAIMESQFIMQFLGGGTIAELVDDEGGAAELVELLAAAGSKLKVAKLSDAT